MCSPDSCCIPTDGTYLQTEHGHAAFHRHHRWFQCNSGTLLSQFPIIGAENPEINYANGDSYRVILNVLVTGKQKPQSEIRMAGLAKSIHLPSHWQLPLTAGKLKHWPPCRSLPASVSSSAATHKPAESELGRLQTAATATSSLGLISPRGWERIMEAAFYCSLETSTRSPFNPIQSRHPGYGNTCFKEWGNGLILSMPSRF